MTEGTSYTHVCAYELEKKCQSILLAIKEVRKRLDDAYLDRAMTDHAWYVKWFWWCGYKPLTREQMHERLLEDMSFARLFSYPSMFSCGRPMLLVESLIGLCRASADGKVRLTANDYASIYG